jgi:gliding motility-associated protein GldC
MSKTSDIQIKIDLDNNKVAEKITWTASDMPDEKEAKAMIMGFWDKHEKNTLRIDLWTKEMTVDEMKYFVHQTLLTLSDSFERATGDNKMAATMRDFCDYYAEKMNFQGPQ